MFGRGGRRSGERIEPRLDDAPRRRGGGDLRADPADRPGSRGRGGRGGRSERAARRPRRSFLGRLVYWGFVLGLWGGVAIAGLFAYYASQLPPIDQLAVPKRPPNIAILADDGSLIANRGDTGGAAVRLSELPPYLPKAFVAIEDRRFYSHFGIDPIGIARAVFRDVTGRGGMEGGSTLTQQLAKNLFLTQERTLSRKIQEAILALWLERKYSKDQILELYLNRVYFGSGAFGVEAAAQKYFGKSARQVTLSEAAVLAGLMKSPTRLAPNRNLTAANERAAQVITAMAEQGHITEAMAKLALASPAQVVHDKSAGSINYAADYVMDMLDDTVGAIDEDIVVTTTLDPRMQAAAEHALTDELNAKGDKFGVEQGALVALDPDGARQGAGRRAQLRRQPIQPRRRRQAPARLVVQAVRLSRGAGEGPDARHGARGRADHGQGLEPGELFARVFRSGHADQGAGDVAQHGGGQARAGSRAEDGRAHRASARHHLRARAQCVDRARHLGGDAARAGRGLRLFRQRRHRRAAARHRPRAHRQRQAALRPQERQFRPRHRPAIRRDDEFDDGRDAADRHRAQGGAAGLAGGGQDRHQPGLARRVVRRLHQRAHRRRLARQRRQFADQEDFGRQSAGRNLEPLHEGGARRRAAGASCRPAFGATPTSRRPTRRRRRRPRRSASRWRSAGRRRAPTRRRRRRSPRARRPIAPAADDGAPLPPAAIPNAGDAPAPRAPRDRNFIEKLLGGA